MDISRRHFLWITAGIVASGGAFFILAKIPKGIEQLVDHPEDVARFGVMHLCDDFNLDEARQRLYLEQSSGFNQDAVITELRRLIQDNLERADLVMVEGWFVTRTEADLAALIAKEREEGLSCS